ncbi:type II secretion system minor pseudopilin GspK [Variovorax ginsengisoli]|uniref:Type II secretion system protein K n=1 Tax=Variovorax ginsengisoli TaxID=363844 RepID=A0ABT9S897_9BURK|nr:type II secretion system minor pseudopilin GspK [Variovorax ginsengisoli]MDP9900578.1 general secretion pathway protein K [Variovorax ginsengisoli]
MKPQRAQRGAALLAAMLTVTLVATFAAAALWQQWRSAEIEAAERTRMQSAWVLIGALDWSRIILREDGNSPVGQRTDNLSEPWAIPLEEARLTSFLAADKNIASDALEGLPDAFLSGRIIDAQSKLNATNLIQRDMKGTKALAAFRKLFTTLGLPAQEAELLASNLRQAAAGTAVASAAAAASAATTATAAGATAAGTTANTSTESGDNLMAPLMPQQVSQLVWLGLSPTTVAAIEPYVTVLPEPTTLNLNTASAVALAASIDQLDPSTAQQLVAERTRSPFNDIARAQAIAPQADMGSASVGVTTLYFEVFGRLRIDDHWVQEHSLLKRTPNDTVGPRILWRERLAGTQTLPR